MKVYTKVVVDMNSMEIVESEWFEWNGEVAKCAGGGGSATSIDADVKDRILGLMDDNATTVPSPYVDVTVRDLINNSLSEGGNPYAGEVAYNPRAELDDMDKVVEDLESNIMSQDVVNNWDRFVEAVEDVMSRLGIGYDSNIDIGDIANRAADIAKSIIEDSISSLTDSARDVSSDINKDVMDTLSYTFTKLASDIASDTDVDEVRNVLESAVNIAETITSVVKGISKSTQDSMIDDAKEFSEYVLEKIESLKNDSMGQYYDVVNMFKSMNESDVEKYSEAAASLIATNIGNIIDLAVDKAIDTFQQLVNNTRAIGIAETAEHTRRLNRFQAAMDEFQAVQSSTYILGLAIIESELERSIELAKAEKSDLAIPMLEGFLQALSISFSNTMNMYLASVDKYANQVFGDKSAVTQIMVASMDLFIKHYINNAKDAAEVFMGNQEMLARHVDVFRSIKSDSAIKLAMGLQSTETAMATLVLQELANLTSGHVKSSITSELSQRDIRSRFALSGANQIAAGDESVKGRLMQVSQMGIDVLKVKIAAYRDEVNQNVELDVGHAKWDFDVMQAGANIVAAVGGAVVSQPVSLTKTESALSGALAGASLGVKTGNPYIAIGGALVGGLGGYLAGGE